MKKLNARQILKNLHYDLGNMLKNPNLSSYDIKNALQSRLSRLKDKEYQKIDWE